MLCHIFLSRTLTLIQFWAFYMLACTNPPVPEAPAPRPSAGLPEPGLAAPTDPRYAGSHILIAWKGSVEAPKSVVRTEAEARVLAQRLHDRATPENFAQLARENSDGPSAPRGGRLGTWLTGTMVDDFERAVASVEPGSVGPVVRTPFGYHVVLREPVQQVHVSHILVSYAGALQSGTERSRDEALARAQDLRRALTAGESFEELARKESDDTSRKAAGDLGLVARGQMVPAFEDAAFSLEDGELSEVIESPYGFHILLRHPEP